MKSSSKLNRRRLKLASYCLMFCILPMIACSEDDHGNAADTENDSSNVATDTDANTASDTDADTATDTDADTDTATDTDTDADTDTDTDSEVCSNLPLLPRPSTLIEHVLPSEDFVFDKTGHLLHVTMENTTAVRKTTYDGTTEVLTQIDNSWPQGTRLLANGELVVTNADSNQLVRIYPNGGHEPLAMGIAGPNGIAVDMKGFLYVTSSQGKVFRVDPVANTYDTVFEKPGRRFDGITFSPDYKTLYFNEEDGDIYEAPVNEDGTLGQEVLFAHIDLEQWPPDIAMSILDGMTADVCGNIYVVVMSGRIFRITPTGETEMVVYLDDSVFITATNFGSGFGGWNKEHLYVIALNRGMYEIDLGVEGKPEPHLQ